MFSQTTLSVSRSPEVIIASGQKISDRELQEEQQKNWEEAIRQLRKACIPYSHTRRKRK